MASIVAAEPIIALDGDGVLLDYSMAYGRAWERAFGIHPQLQNDKAYWPKDRWGVSQLSGQPLEQFRSAFDEEFWGTIPAIAGALEACLLLQSLGYRLVCVTALQTRFAAARARNLKDLGFPITEVIATGNDGSVRSPKAAALSTIRPVAFVDDFIPYMVGVENSIHRALIVRDPVGSPNTGPHLEHSDSQHGSLLEFATWWQHQPLGLNHSLV